LTHNRRNSWVLLCGYLLPALIVCALTSVAQKSPAAESKYKGIWEAVNYPDDVQLRSVFFVSNKVGWAAGKGQGGIILHTTNGGEHWEIQLGDPSSNEEGFDDLYFLDASHGWAVQRGGKLVRTSDGTNWEEAGSLPSQFKDYQFTSPRTGIETGGFYNDSRINVTADGGRTWKPTFQCATTLQVEGLTKRVGCYLQDLHFPSQRVGYAVGGGFNGGYAVVAKTDDGGTTWKLVFATTDMETADAVFFTDENHGVIRLKDRKLFATSDGGQSWRGIAASASGSIKFGDPEAGASCSGRSCSFTSDGGEHWLSRDFRFPASVDSFSIPRRDCIYVVGDHGMVYRYRVVPAEYVAKGSIDAPLLSSYGGAINSQLARMKEEVQQLQIKIGRSGGSANPGTPASTSPASVRNANSQPIAAAGQPRNQVSAGQSQPVSGAEATSFSQDSSAGGGFSQDATSAPFGADSQNASAGPAFSQGTGFSQDSGFSQDTGFSQDVLSAPPSQPLQACCGAQMQTLQTDLSSFSQQVPTFTGKYRNLNLLFVGVNMLQDLMGKARGMRAAFLALKKAPNLQDAAIPLQDLATRLDNTSQSVSGGFLDLSAGNAAQSVPGAVSNMLGNEPSGSASPSPNAAPVAQPTPQDPKKKDSTANELKKKLKQKFPY
jgi:photosystem II stability/assembly factor-like uncharacterized protein